MDAEGISDLGSWEVRHLLPAPKGAEGSRPARRSVPDATASGFQGADAVLVGLEAALERFAEFTGARGEKYPVIVRLRENAWEEFTPLTTPVAPFVRQTLDGAFAGICLKWTSER
ncbi:hypothetical protein GCM10010305_18650 [Streptomyces termitum]|uniref:Uncharacterized protein n=1 Tax=Streptomyces termitum TaxID=67368 RepID=A0A918T010_9ACTN|nr:hypothetical protein GCM10010305_18650 [Streptomyces termitum]